MTSVIVETFVHAMQTARLDTYKEQMKLIEQMWKGNMIVSGEKKEMEKYVEKYFGGTP